MKKSIMLVLSLILLLAIPASAADFSSSTEGYTTLGVDGRSWKQGYFGGSADPPIVFEGAISDAFETSIVVAEPTADRTWTIPNTTDTFVGRATTDTLTNKTLISPAFGAGGTPIISIVVYAPSLTPAPTSAAIQTTEQTFTVTGLTTADRVLVNGPVPTSLCPPTTFRVSAANTLAIGFTTLTAAACTPAAGVYNVVAIRN